MLIWMPLDTQKKLDEERAALRAFVREVANQDPAQVTGQRESNKERAEDLCEQWGITA